MCNVTKKLRNKLARSMKKLSLLFAKLTRSLLEKLTRSVQETYKKFVNSANKKLAKRSYCEEQQGK